MMLDRSTIKGFSQRVRKNSDFISRSCEAGEDVHVVTQFVVSLLGLIVFPYAELTRTKVFPACTMKFLYEEHGWPHFEVVRGPPIETLDELIRHLRNAISHYFISFEPPNERTLTHITITFGPTKPRDRRSRLVRFNGAALRDLVERFSARIEELV
jgi:hypothetical protein